MAYITGAGRRVIGFQMAVIIPGQCCYAVTLPQTPFLDGVGQLSAALEGITIGVAVPWVIPGHRHDLLMAVHALGVPDNGGNRQWHVHHQPLHGALLSFLFWSTVVIAVQSRGAAPVLIHAQSLSFELIYGAVLTRGGHSAAAMLPKTNPKTIRTTSGHLRSEMAAVRLSPHGITERTATGRSPPWPGPPCRV